MLCIFVDMHAKSYVLTLCTNMCTIMCMKKHTSNTMRFNITLPADLGRQVKARRNHSGLIAESLREKFAKEDSQKLATILAQAYARAAEEDKELCADWDATTGDGL